MADDFGKAPIYTLEEAISFAKRWQGYRGRLNQPLFNVVATPPKSWDQGEISSHLDEIGEALDFLEAYIGKDGYAVGRSLTHADGALLTILQLVDEWLPIFRGPNMWTGRPKTEAYWRTIGNDPICARLIDETRTALQASMGKS